MSRPRAALLALGATLLFVASPSGLLAGTHNSLMDISADGRLLICSNRDSGTVSVIDLVTNRKTCEIPVGLHPEGVTFLGPGHMAAVAVYGDDTIAFVDSDLGRVTGRTSVFDEPYGLVSNADGSKLFATLEYPGQVAVVNVPTKTVQSSFAAGSFVRGLAISEKAHRLYVTEYLTGVVRALDIDTGRRIVEWAGPASDNLARQVVAHPSRPRVYVPHIRSRVTAAHGAGSIFPLLSVLDTQKDHADAGDRKRIPLDSLRGAFVVSNPYELALSPDGRRMYILFSGTDDMYVCDVLDDDHVEVDFSDYVELGHNPRGVAVAPDGKSVYVYNALDFAVVRYDAETMRRTATISVCDNPLGDEVRLGKILFYSARQPMAGRRWISCASCHPDGDADGRTWQNPEGLRNTQPLAGVAWTHPLHWSADRDEVQDFEHTIRGQLMQGRGLIRGELHPELGPANRGVSRELDALAAYTNSHAYALSPHAKGGLDPSAQRGRGIFFSAESRCATCHAGPFYTDSMPRTEILRHDVGTGADDSTEKKGAAYDTPSLLGVYRSAPYLHHGKAATLRDVLTTFNQGDRHGKTSHLKPEQLDDLVAFLKALPFEDPVPAAKAARMTKVSR